jgi:hypothetical protein
LPDAEVEDARVVLGEVAVVRMYDVTEEPSVQRQIRNCCDNVTIAKTSLHRVKLGEAIKQLPCLETSFLQEFKAFRK